MIMTVPWSMVGDEDDLKYASVSVVNDTLVYPMGVAPLLTPPVSETCTTGFVFHSWLHSWLDWPAGAV